MLGSKVGKGTRQMGLLAVVWLQGSTALHAVCASSLLFPGWTDINVDIIKTLLAKGADADAKDKQVWLGYLYPEALHVQHNSNVH